MKKTWYTETLYTQDDKIGYAQTFHIKKELYDDNSDHQQLTIFENPKFGRVLALDGVIQTTEADEHFYHEMMVHVPIFSLEKAENILVIGGGDGGTIREVCKHQKVKHITMVEIDPDVVDFCKENLPNHSAGAFDDPRVELVFADGAAFVKQAAKKYDVIIVDSTDPIGPGEVLFTQEFYADCHNILTSTGILVTQNGVPFFQPDELKNTNKRQSAVFNHASCYVTVVPTYIGGFMTLSFASDHDYTNLSQEVIQKRFEHAKLTNLKYYTPKIHLASFVLPAFMEAYLS